MSSSFRAKIRMYRQGIGDCFLVSLPREEDDTPFRMVIDCGVVLGTPGANDLIKRIVDSLQIATGGDPASGAKGVIDLLVITHEHWDHVSAFNQVDDWGDRFEIKQVWAAWTENPDDAQAQALDKAKSRALSALKIASAKLGMSVSENGSLVNEMLAFYGMGPKADDTSFALRKTTRDGRDTALGLAGENLQFLEPGGAPIRLDGVANARVFVLGPPRDEKLIKKANPSKRVPETYGFGAGGAAAAVLESLDNALSAQSGPFPSKYNIPLEEAQRIAFFDDHYFNSNSSDATGQPEDDSAFPEDLLGDESWRKIDNEWSSVAADLAMKLDSATNNTSLALAIELEPDGDVLLFPADAQVGNWLSWHLVTWSGDGANVTAGELLRRTRFYKVGHHGSHNATLKEDGLELMEHPGLIAAVPVNHDVAVKKRWHEMPLNELMERLREKTRGRLLRSDEDFPTRPRGVRKKAWEKFEKMVYTGKTGNADKGLYFEIQL